MIGLKDGDLGEVVFRVFILRLFDRVGYGQLELDAARTVHHALGDKAVYGNGFVRLGLISDQGGDDQRKLGAREIIAQRIINNNSCKRCSFPGGIRPSGGACACFG